MSKQADPQALELSVKYVQLATAIYDALLALLILPLNSDDDSSKGSARRFTFLLRCEKNGVPLFNSNTLAETKSEASKTIQSLQQNSGHRGIQIAAITYYLLHFLWENPEFEASVPAHLADLIRINWHCGFKSDTQASLFADKFKSLVKRIQEYKVLVVDLKKAHLSLDRTGIVWVLGADLNKECYDDSCLPESKVDEGDDSDSSSSSSESDYDTPLSDQKSKSKKKSKKSDDSKKQNKSDDSKKSKKSDSGKQSSRRSKNQKDESESSCSSSSSSCSDDSDDCDDDIRVEKKTKKTPTKSIQDHCYDSKNHKMLSGGFGWINTVRRAMSSRYLDHQSFFLSTSNQYIFFQHVPHLIYDDKQCGKVESRQRSTDISPYFDDFLCLSLHALSKSKFSALAPIYYG
jgi:hypothetical protein